MITEKQWMIRNKLIMDLSPRAMSYGAGQLSGSENAEYHMFVQTAMDLVDEEHPPDYLPTGRDKARKHIEHILTQSIRSYRLRRLLPLLAPEMALLVADTIARRGTDKLYWKQDEL